MENQLTQQDLLDRLYSFYHSWHLHGVTRLQGKGEQAYAQLVKIVERDFSTTEQVVQDITKRMVEGALASEKIDDSEPDTDTQMDCPSCGKKWDTSKYSACSCGAILQTPDTQEGVDEIAKSIAIQMTAENFCPECGTEFLSCCKQLLSRQPQKRVTMEWVIKWREELLMRGMPGRDIAELSVEQICKELGIEVEK